MSLFYTFQARSIDGENICFSRYAGQVVLLVNVASRCGFTHQYRGLENLYQRFQNQGFVVLGFPCNQFAQQEPASNADIAGFCTRRYQISFPLFQKIDVNGVFAHPLYHWLQHERPGLFNTPQLKWNFTKFLLDRDGRVIGRYGPATRPVRLLRPIQAALHTSHKTPLG